MKEIFYSFSSHPYFSKYFAKIKKQDFIFIDSFLEKIENLSKDEKMEQCNRMFCNGLERTKSLAIAQEIICASISKL